MKTTDDFKESIENYLEERALYDELFAESYAKPDKNITDCITYILNTVKNSGYNGFAPEEIYSIAVHYYDEIDIEIGKPIECKVVVNRHIELTEEEKKQAHMDAIKRAQDEAYAKLKQQNQRATTKKIEVQPQASLFDF